MPMATRAEYLAVAAGDNLATRYTRIRTQSVTLTDSLEIEDTVVQSMPDVSPTKWHLAHTSWFFEHFILSSHAISYEVFDPAFDYLFNSYYHTAGDMHRRPERGLLSRPTYAAILAYRTHVDEHMLRLIETGDESIASLVTLGLNHEQQHQELHADGHQARVLRESPRTSRAARPAARATIAGSRAWLCERRRRHRSRSVQATTASASTTRRRVIDALLNEHRIANRLVTNAEYLEFIARRRVPRAVAVAVRRLGGRATGKAGSGRCTGAKTWRREFTLGGRRRHRCRRTGRACELLRGGRIRALGRCAAADGSGVGACSSGRTGRRQPHGRRLAAPR